MVKIHFEIPSSEKIAEFIYNLRDTLDEAILEQRSGSACIFAEFKSELKIWSMMM